MMCGIHAPTPHSLASRSGVRWYGTPKILDDDGPGGVALDPARRLRLHKLRLSRLAAGQPSFLPSYTTLHHTNTFTPRHTTSEHPPRQGKLLQLKLARRASSTRLLARRNAQRAWGMRNERSTQILYIILLPRQLDDLKPQSPAPLEPFVETT